MGKPTICETLPKYENPEERQRAMEGFLIKLMKMKSPEGKHISIPYLMEIGSIYQQAENELWEATH